MPEPSSLPDRARSCSKVGSHPSGPCSMQRSAFQVLVDLLEMIEPLDRLVEFRPGLQLLDLRFLRGNARRQSVTVEVLDRVGEIREHGQLAVGSDFRKAAEN